MTSTFEDYQKKVEGTNIDARSLLSTDYFNTFNSVIMLFDMLPEMPDLLEEIDQWEFHTYIQHFEFSGLDFAPLAIDAYGHAPPELRKSFEHKIEGMRVLLEESIHTLHCLIDINETHTFALFAKQTAELLRTLVAEGSSIVHGHDSTMDQGKIDGLF